MAVQRRWGRATKLTLALFLLGTCTAGIAFLPGHASLGGVAIALLAVLRLGQGLALGGSWDGLPSLLALNAPESRRGWYAMLGQLGAPVGFILASSLFAYLYGSLSQADFLSWGWRYPFFVAFAINVVALFARLQLVSAHEQDGLLDRQEFEPVSTAELLGSQGHNVFIGAFAALASYALFHIVTVFPLSWIHLYAQQSITGFLGIQIVGAFLCAGAIVASGWLADRYGRRQTLGSLAVLIGVFSGFAPTLLNGGELDGVRLLGPRTVEFMTADHLGSIPNHDPLLPPGHGFGLGFAVRTATGLATMPGSVGTYHWGGIAGTTFFVDPAEDFFGILMTQAPNQRDHYRLLFRTLAYAALVD
jgi:MFS family permease